MSNALKSAAESTVHTLTDFVEGARDRFEDAIENVKEELPTLSRPKHKSHTTRWALIALVGVLFVIGMMARRRSTGAADDTSTKDATGTRLTEHSLAVS